MRLEGRIRNISDINLVLAGEFIRGAKLIVDVGANDGGDAIRFRDFFRGAAIIAIEPHPGLAAILREIPRIEVHECAASNYDGEAVLRLCTRTGEGPEGTKPSIPAASSLYRHLPERKAAFLREGINFSDDGPTVQVRRLDTILRGRTPDLLHIDAEGADGNVVRGLGAIRPRLIYHERHVFAQLSDCPDTEESMDELMRLLGYVEIERGDYDSLWKHTACV
jgi:FkbM family methyltransferase